MLLQVIVTARKLGGISTTHTHTHTHTHCMGHSPTTTVPVAVDTTMMRRFGGPSDCFLLGCRCRIMYTHHYTTHTNITHTE